MSNEFSSAECPTTTGGLIDLEHWSDVVPGVRIVLL